MKKLRNLKIRTKLIGFTTGILALVIICCIVVISFQATNVMLSHAEDNIDGRTKAKVNAVASLFRQPMKDVQYLSDLSLLQEYINFPQSERKDSLGEKNQDYMLLKRRVSSTFSSFSQAQQHYMQVRYIDEEGKEDIRIDHIKGRSVEIPESDLQTKKSSDYFAKTMKLQKNSFYVSPLNLNKEQGKVQIPYNPVIRYATPVFDNSNSRKGVIVLNLYAEHIINTINDNHDYIDTYLIDNEGYYLFHPDKGLSWARDLGGTSTLYR